MGFPYVYQNGNVKMSLFSDGTKIHEWPDGEIAQPTMPSSIDIKISNYCDAGCAYCHEMSTEEGKHGNLLGGMLLLSQLNRGTEIAIGGGNPLAHPELKHFLAGLKSIDIVANMTVNQFHLKPYRQTLYDYISEGLINGLGISYLGISNLLSEFIEDYEHTVVHMIIGVHTPQQYQELKKKRPYAKILLLGYKVVGRGIDFFSESVQESIKEWYDMIPYIIQLGNVSFDNLAIKQLELWRLFSKAGWDNFYMGNDGQFTMYMDFVNWEYALSSTSNEKFPISVSMKDMFAHVRYLGGN
jgi:hypothetical protein